MISRTEKFTELVEKCFEILQSNAVENLYPPESVQLATLGKLKSKYPKTLVRKSFYQYKAQISIISNRRFLTMNLACMISIIPFIVYCFVYYFYDLTRNSLTSKKRETLTSNKKTAVFYEATKEVLTKTINQQYNTFIRTNRRSLKPSDVLFILSIFVRYPFSYFFVLKVANKIAHYRYNFELHHPKAMICCSEYSFTSSAATQWCENNGLIHYNIMHGEKLFHIMDAFSTFHVYSVWSSFYLDLAKSLESSATEMFIDLPENYAELEELKGQPLPHPKICVFLQSPNLNSWKLLAKKFYPIRHMVKIRPHPRWIKLSEIKIIFAGFEIENPLNVQIFDSIKTSSAVCSMYSTVLFQGYIAGREIILDDITNPEFYTTVRNLKLGASMRPHKLLSQFSVDELANKQFIDAK